MNLIVNGEFKKLIPPLDQSEIAGLEKDILSSKRVRVPIDVWNNTIVDGHNRYAIATKHNIPYAVNEMSFENDMEARVWIRNNQLHRRNLTDGWKVELALQNKAELTAEHEKERVENRRANVRVSNNDTRKSESGKTRKAIANTLGMSTGKVAQAEYVRKNEPEVWEKVKEGSATIGAAYKTVKREKQKEEKAKQVKATTEKLQPTEKKYRVIYADPPWKYNEQQHVDFGNVQETVLGTHYPSMSMQELCDLPVKEMLEDDAVLFLWVTSPLLEESFQIIKAWGFKYKTSMVWDKVKHNVGNYVSVRHEFVLICTKGSATPDNKKLHNSVQRIERTKHSRKPEKFREIIDDIYTYGNRIELFAREKLPEGWVAWGNEK